MAKKSRRRRSKGRAANRQAPAGVKRQPVAAVETRPVSTIERKPPDAQTERAEASRASELAQEYHYVLSDLRRIGILAASMFALLVALALLVQYVL